MSNVFFISDLHLGHTNIMDFAGAYRKGADVSEHDEWLLDNWTDTVSKRDVVFVLGDVAFNPEAMKPMRGLPGTKYLVRGNHDTFDTGLYLKTFDEIYGLARYKEFWLSHAPIHPIELRKKANIHGHVHQNSIKDPRYYNVCVELVGGKPHPLDEIRHHMALRKAKEL